MSAPPLRVVFMGTPAFAVPALQSLIDSEHEVIAVYSQPPRPKGRGQQVQKSPVHELADAYDIPVHTPLSLKKDATAVAAFQSLQADVAIVAAYGLILPLSVLSAPKHGCLNIHASLLPRWRGASPIQHAIWKGDKTSGVTIMRMEEGLDTGPMIVKSHVEIAGLTTQQLHDILAGQGGPLVLRVLDDLRHGREVTLEPQDDRYTSYAPLLKKEDGQIDWSRSASEIDAQVRALNPWPGTFTVTASGKRLKILAGNIVTASGPAGTVLKRDATIACGEGGYRLVSVQPDNSKPMDGQSALNGGHFVVGEVLT